MAAKTKTQKARYLASFFRFCCVLLRFGVTINLCWGPAMRAPRSAASKRSCVSFWLYSSRLRPLLMRKSPEECIYCGSKSKMTREHIFGSWLSAHFPKRKENTYHITSHHSYDPTIKSNIPSMAKGALHRPGRSISKQIKIVCAKCNETWMGDIQTEAKPYLLKLINSRW